MPERPKACDIGLKAIRITGPRDRDTAVTLSTSEDASDYLRRMNHNLTEQIDGKERVIARKKFDTQDGRQELWITDTVAPYIFGDAVHGMVWGIGYDANGQEIHLRTYRNLTTENLKYHFKVLGEITDSLQQHYYRWFIGTNVVDSPNSNTPDFLRKPVQSVPTVHTHFIGVRDGELDGASYINLSIERSVRREMVDPFRVLVEPFRKLLILKCLKNNNIQLLKPLIVDLVPDMKFPRGAVFKFDNLQHINDLGPEIAFIQEEILSIHQEMGNILTKNYDEACSSQGEIRYIKRSPEEIEMRLDTYLAELAGLLGMPRLEIDQIIKPAQFLSRVSLLKQVSTETSYQERNTHWIQLGVPYTIVLVPNVSGHGGYVIFRPQLLGSGSPAETMGIEKVQIDTSKEEFDASIQKMRSNLNLLVQEVGSKDGSLQVSR